MSDKKWIEKMSDRASHLKKEEDVRMCKSSVMFVCVLLAGILTGSVYAQGMDSFFLTVEEPTRNNYSGVTGIQFTVNETITVLALGRPITTTFDQDHTLTLWRAEDQEIIAQAVVGPNSTVYEVDSGSFAYEMLDNDVVLLEGKTYRLMSEEFNGGDNWTTCYMVTPGEDITDVATIDGIPWGAADVYPDGFDATPNKVDIGCTFFYGTGATAAVNAAGKLCITWASLKHVDL